MMRSVRKLWGNNDGAVAALYALTLPALIAVAGVGFDYSRLAGMDSELQNAADQAALAGVTQLDGKDRACARAAAAASTLVSNETLLSNDGQGLTIAIPLAADCEGNSVIKFWKTVDSNGVGETAATGNTDANYVEIVLNDRAAHYAFTPIAGALMGSLHAAATAGLHSAVCKAEVMYVCNPSNDPNFIVNNYIGVGMELGTTKLSPGNWGFIGNSPNNNERADVLGWNASPEGCVAIDDQELPVNTGNSTNGKVVDAFNTRFDMGSCPGNGSCSASTNATKDLVNTSSGCSTSWGEPAKPYAPVAGTLNPLPSDGSQDPAAMGYPRDICQASGGNCRARGPAGVPSTVGDGVWDIDAYFRVNYGGIGHAGWMAATGLPANALRYDVYRWELAHPTASLNGHTPMSTRSFASVTKGKTTTFYAHNGAQCLIPAITPSLGSVDRRLVTLAVVSNSDCASAHGNHPVPVESWIDVFLVEPIASRTLTYANGGGTDGKAIYVEVVRATPTGGQAQNPVRRDVPYLLR